MFATGRIALLITLIYLIDSAWFFAQAQSNAGSNATEDFLAQNKSELDVRDHGVDCTFTHDSSAALNALTNNGQQRTQGRAITFPPGCHVRLANTWLIKNLAGFSIRGTSGAGAAGYFALGVPTITWTGAPGGTMIDMQFVHGFIVENLAIEGNGLAGVGFNVDRYGSGGTLNTSDGIFRRVNVGGHRFQGGVDAQPTWVAMQFSMKQLNNVEDMRITDSNFVCGSKPTSGTAAIVIGPSFNPKNFKIEQNFIHLCNRAVWQQGGSALVASNELGSNHIDIELDAWTDPNERIIDNLSESAESSDRFLLVNGDLDHWVEISGNNIPVNDTCSISLNGGTFFSANANTFYNGYRHGTVGHKLCDLGQHGPTWLAGPGWAHNLTPEDLAYFEAVSIKNNSSHSPLDAFGITNLDQALILGTGTRFFTRGVFYAANDNAYGLGNATSGGAIGSTPCGINSLCLNEGASETAGVASPDGLVCTLTGNSGNQNHAWYVSAVDSTGNETFPHSNGNYSTCYKAPVAYDQNTVEMLNWVASPNADSYRLYLGNPVAPGSQIALVASGIRSTSYKFLGPLPKTFPLHAADNPYNKTLAEFFRGREFDFQYGTPLKGFSDKGRTQKWSIDSSSGAGTFVSVDTAAVRLEPSSAPKCDAVNRGQVNYVAGGKGEKDVVQICMKAADESYAWRVLY